MRQARETSGQLLLPVPKCSRYCCLSRIASPFFYRTARGAGIDLVLEFDPDRRWAIEIKRSLTQANPSIGFHNGSDDIEAQRRLVIYPGTRSFMQGDNVETLPLKIFMQVLAELQ